MSGLWQLWRVVKRREPKQKCQLPAVWCWGQVQQDGTNRVRTCFKRLLRRRVCCLISGDIPETTRQIGGGPALQQEPNNL